MYYGVSGVLSLVVVSYDGIKELQFYHTAISGVQFSVMYL
jgi:hypothetical protein